MGGENDGGAAWYITTGKLLWKPTANADNCQDDGYAGGPALVALRRCGDYARPSLSVQTLDPATGQPLSTYKVSSAFRDVHVPSSKPLIVGGSPGEGSGAKVSDIYSIDEKTSKELAHITIPDEKYAIDCKNEVGTCLGPLAGGGKLFLPTADHDNLSPDVPGHTNEFVAFDLNTGKPLPGRADAGDRGRLFASRTDGNNVIALRTPSVYGHGAVVRIDGASMKQTVLMELPNDDKLLNSVLGSLHCPRRRPAVRQEPAVHRRSAHGQGQRRDRRSPLPVHRSRRQLTAHGCRFASLQEPGANNRRYATGPGGTCCGTAGAHVCPRSVRSRAAGPQCRGTARRTRPLSSRWRT